MNSTSFCIIFYQEIDEKDAKEPMVFPALTICNMNSIRMSQVTRDDVFHIGQMLGYIVEDEVSAYIFGLN